MSFAEAMSYGDYLHVDGLLAQQHPLSDAHDEMLFIIQHQTSELWMKLALHELEAARMALRSGEMAQMFKVLARVARIFEQLNAAWGRVAHHDACGLHGVSGCARPVLWLSIASVSHDRVRAGQPK